MGLKSFPERQDKFFNSFDENVPPPICGYLFFCFQNLSPEHKVSQPCGFWDFGGLPRGSEELFLFWMPGSEDIILLGSCSGGVVEGQQASEAYCGES